ncbi:endopeptidase La [Lagierella sp.]|uniref:endopeptidase La n=1 Tax=Lagierella sp. TaxID=2849657 RepID=UPI0026385D09|nr:endopeptidase La [Lagierella sp.]
MDKEKEKMVKNLIPVIPLRGVTVYPQTIIHFDVGRPKSVKALETSILKDNKILLIPQKDPVEENPSQEDLFDYGVCAEIRQTLKLPNGTTRVLVEGIFRCKVVSFIEDEEFFQVEVEELVENIEEISSEKLEVLTRLLLKDVQEFIKSNPLVSEEMIIPVLDTKNPTRLADIVSSYLELKPKDYYSLIKEDNLEKRLEILHEILIKEIEYLKIEEEINNRVNVQINKSQREYFLKEQLSVIKEELGEEDEESIVENYTKKIKKLKLDKESEKHVLKEVKRLEKMSNMSPEVNVIQSYLDEILSINWNKKTKESYDIKKARDILNSEHYALEDVKERILEYIAVKKLTDGLKGPILCLVGPPGVGKTSIVKSIAKATNRNFVSMRLGGVRDEAEIRGHRKTYIGAMPGKIIKLMEDANSTNPVFLLDEIDKLASDFRGDPASALLEVLDPAQNDSFVDNYLEIPFDLSKVMFITTANSLNTIPDALLDRMEIIRIAGYTEIEKLNIAKRHLIPKQLKEHGISESQFRISDNCIKKIILNYTREAGVRNLERIISKAIRKSVIEIVEKKKKSIRIDGRNLEKYIGSKKIIDDDIPTEDMVGIVNGLAWTSVGGEILTIEANIMKGSGKLKLTGMLGDVMKESAQAAVSYIRSNQDELNIKGEFYKDKDIHLHFPEGAVPKDGPSAGISITTALVSALSGKKVSHNIAMTGEITLRGRVLPIGGVKEKVLAANRYGIKTVILPYGNKKDLTEIPENVQKNMEIKFAQTINEVLDLALKEK